MHNEFTSPAGSQRMTYLNRRKWRKQAKDEVYDLECIYYFLPSSIHQLVTRRLGPVHSIDAVSQSIQPAVLELTGRRRDTVV
jgi:hypothetical protein